MCAHRLTQFSLNCDHVERLLAILQQVPHLFDLEYVHIQLDHSRGLYIHTSGLNSEWPFPLIAVYQITTLRMKE